MKLRNPPSTQRSRLIGVFAILALFLTNSCVDERQTGLVGALLLPSDVPPDLRAGASLELTLQVVDDAGDPLTGANIETYSTNTGLLQFTHSQSDRIVVQTKESVDFQGVVLKGAVVLQLQVPNNAESGSVTIIASAEGERAANPTTVWMNFNISAKSAMGGAGGSESGSGMGGSL